MLSCEALTGDALVDVSSLGRGWEFTDNHMHIDPKNGRGLDAAREFEAAGGRNIFLVNKNVEDAGIVFRGERSFEKLFEYTIDLSKEIIVATNLRCFAVIGVHPAEFAGMCGRFGVDKALGMGKGAIDIAVGKIEAGEAVALGEIGVPHYPVEPHILEACGSLLIYSLEAASDVDCAVQLHTGSVDEDGMMEYGEMARAAGLDAGRVVKHFSPPLIKAAAEAGIYPSIVARDENIKRARKEGNRFLMESDYIDDLKRPGAVVSPKSVPRVSGELYDLGVLDEDDLWRIHIDNVEEVYRVALR
ncbi:MAG: TatD family hydrolase [Candidatus Hydrothermarchaeaceae archaeon]